MSSSKLGRLLWAACGLAAAGLVGVTFVGGRLTADPGPPPPAPPARAAAFGIGAVEPAGEVRALATKAGGVVRRCHVRPGDVVAAGTPLVELDDAATQAELAAARADLDLARADRDEAGAGVNAHRIQAAERAVERLRERDRHAAAERTRVFGLASSRAVSQQERDAVETAVTQTALELKAQEAELRSLQTAVTPERRAVAAAKVARAEAAVRLVEERVRSARLAAPFAGTVLRVLKREGEGVRNTDPEPVLLFADTTALRVRAEIDEHHSGRVAVGQAVRVSGRNLAGKQWAGRVVRVEPAMGTKTLFSRSAEERKDLEVREVLVEPEAGFTAPVGLKVDVEVQLGDAPGPGPLPATAAGQ